MTGVERSGGGGLGVGHNRALDIIWGRAWSVAPARISASGSRSILRGLRDTAVANGICRRSQTDPWAGQVGSRRRLCGDFRGFENKVNPRVSHRLKSLAISDRADRQKRRLISPQLEHSVEHMRAGISKPEPLLTNKTGRPRAGACQVVAQKQPESGPIGAGPATAGLSRLSAVPAQTLERAWRAWRAQGGVHVCAAWVRPGHLNAWNLTERDAQQFHVGAL